ncbi:MAG: ThuA domain-containing protein [Chitinophagaceae bacterium]|nr:ThuA domain-containing protein [Chitinophagaceae bacterium]
MRKHFLSFLFLWVSVLLAPVAFAQDQWAFYKGGKGPGKGKHIVWISGDEEYRSEEALPMLAQILSARYGFDCTVLFAIDPKTGAIDGDCQTNIPGLKSLASADLMVIFTRFRELPDEQMKYIDQYLASGKPVVALRTSTHAFNYKRNKNSPYAKYDFVSSVKGWEGGFGKRVLGETWVDHHGKHGVEGTRGLIDGIAQNAGNPILKGVKDIWCYSDVYTIRKLPADAETLVYGQSTRALDPQSAVNLDKSIIPVAWTRTYANEAGKKARVFATTMGASIDLLNEDLRRLLVNACLWAVNLEAQIPERADVGFISPYNPTMFGFGQSKKGVYPSDFKLK